MEPNRVSGWRAVVRVLRSPLGLLDDLVTTFFPANCRCCHGPLLRAGVIPVCEGCVTGLTPEAMPCCWQCGEAMDLQLNMEDARYAAQMAASLRCRECRMAEPAFERAVSYGAYQRELRVLIQLFKFDALPGLSRVLGDRMAEAMLQLEPVEMLVVAVPLFRSRQRQRGYNQSVLLADRAVERLKKIRPEWRLSTSHRSLKRVRRTEAQFTQTLRQRRLNLRGAFEVTEDFRGRGVLLVDDILTSGATARECARVLKAAGAAQVWVVTLARAQKQEFARRHEDPGDGFVRWETVHATV